MKLKEALINSGLIESNKIIELDCSLKKYSKRINVNIKLEKSLCFDNYIKLFDFIKSYLGPLNCGIFVDIKFEMMTLSLDELIEFTKKILESLE